MKSLVRTLGAMAVLALAGVQLAQADSYTSTISRFKEAGQSAKFFNDSYAYAVFPTIGGAGFIVGAAHGKGRVYEQGKLIGDATMTLVSAGLQAGGKAYSQIIFFQDKSALENFESGNFEFGADASAVAITASAGASAGTSGASSHASGDEANAKTTGAYYKGMAVFTIAKGGLMYEAALAGQKFSYTPRGGG